MPTIFLPPIKGNINPNANKNDLQHVLNFIKYNTRQIGFNKVYNYESLTDLKRFYNFTHKVRKIGAKNLANKMEIGKNKILRSMATKTINKYMRRKRMIMNKKYQL